MNRKRRHSPIEDALMLALSCGATVEAAAAKSNVSKRTVYRYLEDEAFRGRLQSYRSEMVHRATGMLTAAAMEAVKTLLGLMASGSSSASRLGSARCVLELGLKLRQASEMEERMAKIEERMQRNENRALSKQSTY